MAEQRLGELMKAQEHKFRRYLPEEDYLLIRLDGRAFHTYTKRLKRPFDKLFQEAMEATMLALCEEIQGVRFAYTQSDEISLLVTSWKNGSPSDSNPTGIQQGQLWMGGVEAKILSLASAIATAKFNDVRMRQAHEEALRTVKAGESFSRDSFHKNFAYFDARLWTFSGSRVGRELVKKYFLWRQRDAYKNAITMAALSQFSHRELHEKNTDEKIEMLSSTVLPESAIPAKFKVGTFARKERYEATVSYTRKDTGAQESTNVMRSRWLTAPFVSPFDVWTEETLPNPAE